MPKEKAKSWQSQVTGIHSHVLCVRFKLRDGHVYKKSYDGKVTFGLTYIYIEDAASYLDAELKSGVVKLETDDDRTSSSLLTPILTDAVLVPTTAIDQVFVAASYRSEKPFVTVKPGSVRDGAKFYFVDHRFETASNFMGSKFRSAIEIFEEQQRYFCNCYAH